MNQQKLINIIVPAYNEEECIRTICDDLYNVIKGLKEYRFEVLLINDGSVDDTQQIIDDICKTNKIFKCYKFSRNFGKEAATTAGINFASGDAAIIIDADGQHPVRIIPKFIESWEHGYDVVIGIRESNKGEGLIKKCGSKLYYILLGLLIKSDAVPCSTDYRLIDKKVIKEFNKLTERVRITRGLIDWLGFKKTYLPFSANERSKGRASYSVKKLFNLALQAFVSQSTRPLKAVGLLGAIVTLLSVLAGVVIIIEKYLLNDSLRWGVTGTAILAIFLSFLIGIVLICQGLLALYVESIHNETQNRPLYIIDKND